MPRKRRPKLVSFRPDRERAKGVEDALYDACRDAIEVHGDRMAGFALVALDVFGDAFTRIHIDAGPVGHGLLPSFAHDAINRQIAIDAVAEDQEADSGTG